MNRLKLSLALVWAMWAAVGGQTAWAGEIGWIESFALAADRTVSLDQLIPGTEDYYYFHALHYQNTEQWEKVEPLLKLWVDRYQWTPRAIEIQNRQALLTYGKDPARALALIRNRLNLQFNHQREELNQKPNLPAQLDPALIARQRLDKQAFDQFPGTLQGFEDAALERLFSANLNPDQQRQLLARIHRPDHPGLVKLILAELKRENNGGFGAFEIHHRLLLSQLDELVKLKPDLRNQAVFVNDYLQRLRPSDDSNWQQDPQQTLAYLERLWSFVTTLDPVHNSLKAHVLYHRLVFDRAQDKYDRERFLEYLKLPKHASYVEPKFLALAEHQQYAANLQQDFRASTLLAPIGDDEPLVRSYLARFFVTADDYKVFLPFVSDTYLKQAFAETKIVSGLGDAEKWYAMLPPATYQQLKERIDLDFAYTNKTELSPDDPVGIDLYVKNVETLIVRVFEINTQNVYRETLKDVGTDINLDGLIANQEKTYTYKEPPLRRVRRHFEFPSIDQRGVYVIDFIGNGKSSRALVRKGKLHYLVRTSVAGQVFTVFDEQEKLQPQATLWLAGKQYYPDKDGTITVPFSNQPGRQPIVLGLGGFSSLDQFQQESESYAFKAGMYVDREELIARRKALLIVRPQLILNHTPVSLKVLEDVRLSIVSTDLDGVESSKEVPDFKLLEDRESTYEFQVPQRLARLRFQLRARVQNQSQNQKVDLSAEHSVSLNGIDRTEKTEDLLFARVGDDYVIDLLGRSGELKANRPLQVSFKMRQYTQAVNVPLQTDAQGRTVLGPLDGVESVTTTGPQGTSHVWDLREDRHTYPGTINADTDHPIEVPFMGGGEVPDRAEISLLEMRGQNFVADRFDNISLDGALLRIEKLPPGNYSLLLKRTGRPIQLRVTQGPERAGYVMGDYRKLELRGRRPLQIKPAQVGDQTVRIALQNVSPLARVHIFATRFRPDYSAYGQFARIVPAEPRMLTTPRAETQYVGGRSIGDEYQYIIDRKFARKYPGNMLERPSLLLNPWAIRSTETGEQLGELGAMFSKDPTLSGAYGGKRSSESGGPRHPDGDFANLDFLADSSLVLANVVPDKNGIIEIKRTDLGPHQELLFVAVDAENTVSRIVVLPQAKNDFLDLRLAKGLDPEQHFTQQKQITILAAGGKLVIPDVTSTRFEAYDSVARVFALYTTLTGDTKLADFSAVANWPTLKAEEKQAFYLKYASHELHFFLLKRDPEFFKLAVHSYLANKKEKQFLDRWLLADDLSDYSKAWNFAQLNTFEQILLGQKIAAERAPLARLVKDQVDLLPPDPERFARLFETALKGSELETNDAFGVQLLQKQLQDKEVALAAQVPAPAPAPSADAPAGAPMEAADAESSINGIDGRAMIKLRTPHGERRKALGLEAKKDAMEEADRDEVLAYADDSVKLGEMQQYYRKLDKTMEWVESNYYKLPLEQQNAALIAASAFWNDYAAHDPAKPFLSKNLADATHGFPEMIAALTLLDLPFAAAEHKTEFDGAKMTLSAGSPMVVYHEEIQPALKVAENTPILVSENFFRYGDRYRQVGGEQVDKFVADEFLADTVYGCQIVVTNPTSSKKKVDVLLQIPTGALPVMAGQVTRSVHLDLDPYHTQSLEYHFYFPAVGKFSHYGVQVAAGGEVLAFSAPSAWKVVGQLSNIDKESWDYISQQGSDEDVLQFLKQQNILRVNLDRMAWRMQDEKFFRKVIVLLSARHVYNGTLWSYGVKHNDAPAIRQYLQFVDDFVRQCGDWLDSPLLTIDPIVRKTYEQMDYRPLVNARVGQFKRNREILNDRFLAQYERLLKILSYRRQLDDTDLMTITYYLLLQDRVDEALAFFGRVNADRLETRLQYDYLAAYLDFSKSQPKQARQIAARYADYPVERWREAFANVVNQADEINRPEVKVADNQDRTQLQTSEAAATPALDFTIEAKKVRLDYQRLKTVEVSYYLMDIELLFSRNPFVQGESKQFAQIVPNVTQTVELPADATQFAFDLPEELVNSNVLVEIAGAGVARSQVYYSNALGVQLTENYGQVRVTLPDKQTPLAKVYVKVYARLQGGEVRFYKDGYTDLRGRFDYTSLNTNELDVVERFALLILSEDRGAIIREANPPKR